MGFNIGDKVIWNKEMKNTIHGLDYEEYFGHTGIVIRLLGKNRLADCVVNFDGKELHFFQDELSLKNT